MLPIVVLELWFLFFNAHFFLHVCFVSQFCFNCSSRAGFLVVLTTCDSLIISTCIFLPNYPWTYMIQCLPLSLSDSLHCLCVYHVLHTCAFWLSSPCHHAVCLKHVFLTRSALCVKLVFSFVLSFSHLHLEPHFVPPWAQMYLAPDMTLWIPKVLECVCSRELAKHCSNFDYYLSQALNKQILAKWKSKG